MFTQLLAHLCTIQERASDTDRFGQPSGDWSENQGQLDIPCRLRAATGKEITTMATRDKLEVTHVVYLDGDVTIDEDDRILNVKEKVGATILAQELNVVLVKHISKGAGEIHHLEVFCWMVKKHA